MQARITLEEELEKSEHGIILRTHAEKVGGESVLQAAAATAVKRRDRLRTLYSFIHSRKTVPFNVKEGLSDDQAASLFLEVNSLVSRVHRQYSLESEAELKYIRSIAPDDNKGNIEADVVKAANEVFYFYESNNDPGKAEAVRDAYVSRMRAHMQSAVATQASLIQFRTVVSALQTFKYLSINQGGIVQQSLDKLSNL